MALCLQILVPVHLAGSSCDMRRIYELSHKYGFKIIEDASHAIGAQYNSEPVGNCKYSDICVFSFHPVKIITTGEGGIATTNCASLAQRMTDLRRHGITKDIFRFKYPAAGKWSYEQHSLGYNYRMSDIHAALGISQLSKLKFFIQERHNIYSKYNDLISGSQASLLVPPPNVLSSLHLAIVLLNHCSAEQHKDIFEKMLSFKIGVQLHYTPVHLQPYYKDLGFSNGDFPNAESYSTKAFSIPIFPGLTLENQEYIIDRLNQAIDEFS